MNSDPLISIGIISFNNENYIGACIESCLSQTYKNIEIIIADDASTDNSMQIIKEYALLYPSKITFISSQENYGISTNFNNAVKASKGEWFKPIACDDVLFEDCVENYMKEVFKQNLTSGILFSKMQYLGLSSKKNISTEMPEIFKLDPDKKIHSILIDNTLPAPTAFFNMSTLYKLGLSNEKYPFLEDYPLWLKAILNNVNLNFVDIISVKYRHHDSISNPKNKIGNSKFYKSQLNFLRNEIWQRRTGFSKLKNIDDFISINGALALIKIFSNKKTFLYRILSFFLRVLKPYSMIKKILKILHFSR
jgi:glycosyltransferase involved in cell wall biosynthesis